jgi:phage shock protein A
MAKELTLEEALVKVQTLSEENTALKGELSNSLEEVKALSQEITALKGANESLTADKQALELLISENEEVVKKATNEVPGVFKHEKATYRFKKGQHAFSYKGEKHKSVEALKNKALMIELIEIGAGIIEKV